MKAYPLTLYEKLEDDHELLTKGLLESQEVPGFLISEILDELFRAVKVRIARSTVQNISCNN